MSMREELYIGKYTAGGGNVGDAETVKHGNKSLVPVKSISY